MRIAFVVMAIAACSGRAAPEHVLADDVAMFCGAWQANGGPARMSDLEDYIASRIKSTELREVFARIGPDDDSWPQLYSSLHSEKKYPVRPPAVRESPELVLTVSAGGAVSDHGAPIATADVEMRARAAYVRDRETSVSIIADPAVPFQRVLTILDAAKRVGLARFAFGADAAHLIRLPRQRTTDGSSTTPGLMIGFATNGDVVVAGNAVADASLDGVPSAPG